MSIIDFAKDFIKVKLRGGIDIEESKKVLGQLTEMADLHELILELGRHRCMSSSSYTPVTFKKERHFLLNIHHFRHIIRALRR
jgi:hypothetical protein